MKNSDFLSLIDSAMATIDASVQSGQFAEETEGMPSNADLVTIRRELDRIRSELLASPKSLRGTDIGRMIGDNWWKFDNAPLTRQLMQIVDLYQRKRLRPRRNRMVFFGMTVDAQRKTRNGIIAGIVVASAIVAVRMIWFSN